MRVIGREQLQEVYIQACELELRAFKPGNVSIYADGHDMSVADFRRSAAASAAPLTDPNYTLGEKIYYAVKATREAVGCNTNLGIILLCAPLIQAVQTMADGLSLRKALHAVLSGTTIADADWVFRAIVIASPGGLGEAPQQDVHETAQVTLLEAMALAAERDRIASQYTTNYKDIFDFAILKYNEAFDRLGAPEWAAVAVYAALLRQFPDSHIERKYGNLFTEWVSAQMALVEERLSAACNPEHLKDMLYRLDSEFKTKGINPGTMADMTVATLLAAKLESLIGDSNNEAIAG